MSEASDKLLADFAETIDPTLQEWMNYYERLSSLSSHRASQKHVLCSNSIAAEERAVFNVESELIQPRYVIENEYGSLFSQPTACRRRHCTTGQCLTKSI